MGNFYHYTHTRRLRSILETGLNAHHPLYTAGEFFHSRGGDLLGVNANEINCVLSFLDDGQFVSHGTVGDSGRHPGGADQYAHPLRLKPVAVRSIRSSIWRPVAAGISMKDD